MPKKADKICASENKISVGVYTMEILGIFTAIYICDNLIRLSLFLIYTALLGFFVGQVSRILRIIPIAKPGPRNPNTLGTKLDVMDGLPSS